MQSRPTFSKGSTLRPALFALLNGYLFAALNVKTLPPVQFYYINFILLWRGLQDQGRPQKGALLTEKTGTINLLK